MILKAYVLARNSPLGTGSVKDKYGNEFIVLLWDWCTSIIIRNEKEKKTFEWSL
jgi:hypothetical protein